MQDYSIGCILPGLSHNVSVNFALQHGFGQSRPQLNVKCAESIQYSWKRSSLHGYVFIQEHCPIYVPPGVEVAELTATESSHCCSALALPDPT